MKHVFENIIFWNTTGFFMLIELIYTNITVFNWLNILKMNYYYYVINRCIKWRFTIQCFIQFISLLFCTDLISYTWIINDIVAIRQKPRIRKFELFFPNWFYWPPFRSVHIINQWMYSKSSSPAVLLSHVSQFYFPNVPTLWTFSLSCPPKHVLPSFIFFFCCCCCFLFYATLWCTF